jgi:DNA-binding NtrC family response regulator
MELARRFRRDKPGLKVILSSGYKSGAALMADAAHSGIIFLPKPVLWDELAKALHTILQPRRLPAGIPLEARDVVQSERDVSQ